MELMMILDLIGFCLKNVEIEFIINMPEEKYAIRFKNPGMGVVRSSTYNCSENLSNKIHELWNKLLYE